MTRAKRWGASETVIRTTVRVKIPVTIEIEVRVPADASRTTVAAHRQAVKETTP